MILGGIAAASVAVLAVAFVLTRGGDDTTPASADETPGTSGTPSGDSTPGDPTATEEPEATSPPEPYVPGEIVALSANMENLTFRAVYDLTGTEQDSGANLDAKLTISSAPPQMAMDIDFGAQGLNLTDFVTATDDEEPPPLIQRIMIIVDDTDTAYICLQAIDPPEASCAASPIEEDTDPEAEPFPETAGAILAELLRIMEEDGEGTIEAAAPDIIAGRLVRCFNIQRQETTEDLTSDLDIRICLDAESGVPLYMEGLGSGVGAVDAGGAPEDEIGAELLLDGVATATEFTFDVGPESFVPPFEVVEDG